MGFGLGRGCRSNIHKMMLGLSCLPDNHTVVFYKAISGTLENGQLLQKQKRENKIRIFQELRDEYAQYSQTKWKGRGWFKHWFDQPINNARLASISTYRAKLPEIEKLLVKCQHDFTDFYQTLEAGKADNEFAVPANCKNS